MRSPPDLVAAWARSGAMSLTGPPTGVGLGPPQPLPDRLSAIADRLASASAGGGREVRIDPLALLTERAAIAGLTRGGDVSCGGGTRLLPGRDGWLAVCLARPSDVDLVPAWFEVDRDSIGAGDDTLWNRIATEVRARPVRELEARGAWLGLPVGAVTEPPRGPSDRDDELPVSLRPAGSADPRPLEGLVVADLSALWAGPLCGRILSDAGATVVKVESRQRPDGARLGPPAFFDLMNAGKPAVAIDLDADDGPAVLVELLRSADVVVESSRPRALEQLGVDADDLLATGPQVWVSITGHGRRSPVRERVAFGDDAAVAGGLVAWADERPWFCADAVADPCSGLVAATAAIEALERGGRWMIDVAMAEVAAHLAGPTVDTTGAIAAVPAAPHARGRGPALGQDDDRYLGRRSLA
jgi:hypothetical protein